MNQPISSSPISRPVVAMMTDFGLEDGDVGVMKGVIAGITPNVHLIDITHDVAPQNVASGAWTLASAYRYFPQGTVFVCVVDPGVGSSRGAIAIYAGNWFFVGPDNGLFSYIFMQQPVHQAVVLDNPAYHLSQVSSTFHGRDNLITSIPLGMVPELFSGSQVHIVFPGTNTVVDRRRRFFAEGPDDSQPFIYGDSSGYVGIAVRNGHAAGTLSAGFATPITLVMGEG